MSATRTTVESAVKTLMRRIIDDQPSDASYDEILRELAFERMVSRGIADTAQGRTIGTDSLRRKVRSWTA